MNRWQVEREIRARLAAAVWPDSPGAAVLTGGAVVSVSPPEALFPDRKPPFALVVSVGEKADRNHPERNAESRFQVVVVALGETDREGSTAISGGTRETSGGQGKSLGRGVGEVLEEVRRALQFLDGAAGLQGHLLADVTTGVRQVAGVELVATTLTLVAFGLPNARSYSPPYRLTAVAGTGQVALTWRLPPARYDRRRVVLRRASGSTPPAAIDDGTGVTLSGDLATSVTVTGLAAGVHSFALFAAYDETGSSADERASSAVTATVTVT